MQIGDKVICCDIYGFSILPSAFIKEGNVYTIKSIRARFSQIELVEHPNLYYKSYQFNPYDDERRKKIEYLKKKIMIKKKKSLYLHIINKLKQIKLW